MVLMVAQEIQQATLQGLKLLAGLHLPPEAVMAVQRNVQVLNNFSSKDKPLVHDITPAFIFHWAQADVGFLIPSPVAMRHASRKVSSASL